MKHFVFSYCTTSKNKTVSLKPWIEILEKFSSLPKLDSRTSIRDSRISIREFTHLVIQDTKSQSSILLVQLNIFDLIGPHGHGLRHSGLIETSGTGAIRQG